MIKLIDIQNHLVKKLKTNFPDHTVYREENQTNPKVPAFYVDVRPLETVGRNRYNNKLVNVSIQYLSANKTNRENLIMAEELEDVFYLILEVYERRLHIGKLSITGTNEVLTVGFTLDYNTNFRLGPGMPGLSLPEGTDRPPGYQGEDDLDLGYGEGKTKYMEELYYNKGDV